MCVLAKVLGNSPLILEKIEEKIPNGKEVDFKFSSETGFELVEVSNIHLDYEKINDETDLERFIEIRSRAKLNDKYTGISDELLHKVNLTQVLWGKIINLETCFSYFLKERPYKGLLSPLMIVAQLADSYNNPTYQFITVAEYIRKYIEYCATTDKK